MFKNTYLRMSEVMAGWDNRLRAQQSLVWAPRGLATGLAAALLAAIAARLFPLLDQPTLWIISGAAALISLLVALLDRSRKVPGTQVFFGSDSGFDELSGCSLITASFTSGRGATGTIGIIGPVRMPYSHIIPPVDGSDRLISQMLKTK